MPDYRKPPKKSRNTDNEDSGGGDDFLVVPERWSESRCHVCMSQYRRAIDRMIALGTNYSEISRIFGGEIDRRSISNHAKKHLQYQDAAIRRIVEHEAQAAQEDAEEGIQGALTRRVYLNVGLQKALEALVSGDVTVEVKDAVAIIQQMDKMDTETSGAALEEMQLQFTAFLQAIREVCPPDEWMKILERTKQLLNSKSALPAGTLPAGDDLQSS